MQKGKIVQLLWGISFEGSWKVQKGDSIQVNGDVRRIEHKEDSVVFVEPFSASQGVTTDVYVNFLTK